MFTNTTTKENTREHVQVDHRVDPLSLKGQRLRLVWFFILIHTCGYPLHLKGGIHRLISFLLILLQRTRPAGKYDVDEHARRGHSIIWVHPPSGFLINTNTTIWVNTFKSASECRTLFLSTVTLVQAPGYSLYLKGGIHRRISFLLIFIQREHVQVHLRVHHALHLKGGRLRLVGLIRIHTYGYTDSCHSY